MPRTARQVDINHSAASHDKEALLWIVERWSILDLTVRTKRL